MATGRPLALVTGAERGIGNAISARLLDSGYDVAMAGLGDAVELGGGREGQGNARYYHFDLADIDQHATLLAAVERDFGPIDCLVNNAGVSSMARGDLLDVTPESFDRAIAVNLRGTFFLTQSVARQMLATAAKPMRSIISIGSVNAEIVGENRADYCISKAGLAMMTKLFATRLAAAGIGVFEIRPGIIRTPMTAPSSARYDEFIEEGGVPLRRWGEPDDVAQAVVSLARGAIPYATGIHLDVAGGMQLHRV